ncbi:hypothetical protein PTKIN_Ptkin13bG0225800 [Pterospermum kingtungense]
MPQNIQHQVDQKHTLVLLSSPAYGTGSFNCNACGKLGRGFCYHCKDCQLVIHTLCINKPSSVNTSTHHHTLELCFSPPYSKKKFQCDICKKLGSNHWLYRCDSCKYDVHMNCAMSNQLQPATEIPQAKQQILCPTDGANTQFQSQRAIQTQQTHQEQLLCQANGPHSQLQPVRGVQQRQQNQLLCHNIIASTHPQPISGIQKTEEQKLHHSCSANIQMQPLRAIQVQQTHQEQLLCHTARANTYAQPVTCVQKTQQQPQLLQSQSFPPKVSKYDLQNSGSTFHRASDPVIPTPHQHIFAPYVQTLSPIPATCLSNWNQLNKVNGYTESIPTLAVHQQVPPHINQMNGSTASTPTFSAVRQYVQPPKATKLGNNLIGHVVSELVDDFIQQAGGDIFQSATSGDLPFDIDIGDS